MYKVSEKYTMFLVNGAKHIHTYYCIVIYSFCFILSYSIFKTLVLIFGVVNVKIGKHKVVKLKLFLPRKNGIKRRITEHKKNVSNYHRTTQIHTHSLSLFLSFFSPAKFPINDERKKTTTKWLQMLTDHRRLSTS